MDTHVFIDVSNIRSSCTKSCNFRIDFLKLIGYLKEKYEKLVNVNYYEGIASDDKEKKKYFEELEKTGFLVRSLTRRTYEDPAIFKYFSCNKCGKRNRVQILPKTVKMKSNVDVFLATEMLEVAHFADKPTHIILFSCDGDYAEAILSAAKNPKVKITVIATPSIKDIKKNTVSIRLKRLRKELPGQYQLVNILSIKDRIS